MTDFEIFGEMSKENMDIAMMPDLVSANSAKGGGHITFGVPEVAFNKIAQQMFSGERKYYVVMYMVNKEQFDKIKADSETAVSK